MLGVFGGTFDPIHFGHLRLAEELAGRLGLDSVRFIPSGRPWHRVAPGATAAQRLEMTRLALAGNPRFMLDEREARGQAPGYTVETLGELRRELGEPARLCLLLGADVFLGLHTWHRWRELFALAHVVVAHRPGFPLLGQGMDPALRPEVETRLAAGRGELEQAPAGKVFACAMTPLDISATSIRAAVKGGESARYLLPEAVLDYIQAQHLYA